MGLVGGGFSEDITDKVTKRDLKFIQVKSWTREILVWEDHRWEDAEGGNCLVTFKKKLT